MGSNKNSQGSERIETILKIIYPDRPEDIKIELIRLITCARVHIQNALSPESGNKKGSLREFLNPYRNDLRIADAYTEVINRGVLLLKDNLSVIQFRQDPEYATISEKVSELHDRFIPQLERKQARKKDIRNAILVVAFVMHFGLYGWLLVFF